MIIGWIGRRWLDFRDGHRFYVALIISLMNFLIISYTLLLERVPLLKEVFPVMWMWAAFMLTIYVPIVVIIGHFHKRTQLVTEHVEHTLNNPIAMFQMRRLDDLSEAIEKICHRLNIDDVEIKKWKDMERTDLSKITEFDD